MHFQSLGAQNILPQSTSEKKKLRPGNKKEFPNSAD